MGLKWPAISHNWGYNFSIKGTDQGPTPYVLSPVTSKHNNMWWEQFGSQEGTENMSTQSVLLLLSSSPAAPHLSYILHTVSVLFWEVWTIETFHINWIPHTLYVWSLSSNCRVCFSVATEEKVTRAKENVSIKARLIWPCCLEGVNRGTKVWLTLLAPVILTNACKRTLRHGFRVGAACSSHCASLSSTH